MVDEEKPDMTMLSFTDSGKVTVTVCVAPGVSPDEVRSAMKQAAQDAEAAVN
ncbi:MAG: hypothetical protein LLF96_06055 [Eubacteriales bacterium]|nr:hypothetical protein [Eubacteriales bacterium]